MSNHNALHAHPAGSRAPTLRLCLLACLALLWCARPVFAQSAIPAAPEIPARAYLLMDHDSGRVIAEREPDMRIPPASITKMMTSFVVYRELAKGSFSLDSLVPVSEKAWRMKGSRMFIEVGNEISVRDLLSGVVIQSGNDASVALAEFVAGSEDAFADYMNIVAGELGMNGTNYHNSTGWPDAEHYTTARDIAALSRALIREFPDHYRVYSQKEYTFNGIVQYNRNKLLWRDDTVDGIKTGHTEEAGYCLVSSALRDGMRLVAVVLGADSEDQRAQASRALLGYGFRFFESHKLYAAGQPLSEVRIWSGEREQLQLGLRDDMFVTIPRGRYKELAAAIQVNEVIVAPTGKFDPHGAVRVTLGEELLQEQPLLALDAVPEGSLWQRARDSVLRYFQ